MGPAIRVGTLAAPSIPIMGIGSFAESVPRISVQESKIARFNYHPSILEQANSVASAAWERTGLNATDAVTEVESILSAARIKSLPALNAADAVLEAESILAQARTTPLTKAGAVAEAEHWLRVAGLREAESVAQKAWEKPQPIEAVLPRLIPQVLPNESFPVLKPAIKTVSRIASPSAYFVSSAVASKHQVEHKQQVEVAKEKPISSVPSENGKNQLVKPDQVKQLWLSHTVDNRAVKIRIEKIKLAARKAWAEAESEGVFGQIEGWRIIKHIPSPQAKSLRGGELNEVDPKGDLPDGTWEANLANIAATNFSSVAAVAEQAPNIVAADNPFIRGKGQGVTNENIATAYKHDPARIHPAERVINRVIRMQKRIEEPDIEEEGKIQEYPDLAEALLATQSNLLD